REDRQKWIRPLPLLQVQPARLEPARLPRWPVVGRIFDRLDYPSQNLRQLNPYVGRCDFRGYTSTLLTESRVYNSPSYRDHSLRRKAKFLLSHEERAAPIKNKI